MVRSCHELVILPSAPHGSREPPDPITRLSGRGQRLSNESCSARLIGAGWRLRYPEVSCPVPEAFLCLFPAQRNVPASPDGQERPAGWE